MTELKPSDQSLKSAVEKALKQFIEPAELQAWQQSIYCYQSVGSTMDQARQLSEDRMRSGVAGPFLVLAEAQTSGRGRQLRKWISEPGRGIFVTYAIPTDVTVDKLAGLSLACGVAVHDFAAECGAEVGLKWPNDVMAKRDGAPTGSELRKLAGMLIEINDNPRTILLGVGLNLFPIEFPADVPGISLSELTTNAIDYPDTVARLSGKIIATFNTFMEHGFSKFQRRWNELSVIVGKPVHYTENGKRCKGMAEDVNADGSLAVKRADGSSTAVYSGDIELI